MRDWKAEKKDLQQAFDIIADKLVSADQKTERLTHENENLKALVKQAFITGWNEGAIGLSDREHSWKLWLRLNSDIKEAIE